MKLFIASDHIWTKYFKKEQTQISIPNNVFHHHFLPNHVYIRHTAKFSKFTIITNSLGFRDSTTREVDLKKNNRIVLIGDSFVEGVVLDYKYTVAGLIDKHFKKKNIEVLNAGISSYSPIIYYHKIKYYLEKGLKFSHLVVFIDISDIEDEAIKYEYDETKESVITKESVTRKNNLKNTIKINGIISSRILKLSYT